MSEIKGQILGIVLTIGVFSAVFAALCGAFNTTASGMGDIMESAVSETYTPTSD